MRLTKKHKVENYDTLQRERDALAEYVWHIVNRRDFDASEQIDRDHDSHEVLRYDVYGTVRACGGVVVTLHYHDNQSTGFSVDYFDDWCEKIRALGYATDHTTALQYVRERLIRKISAYRHGEEPRHVRG